MSTLFNADDSDTDSELKINSIYAKDYDHWRQKEELNKLKTKYGEHVIDEAASDDETSSSSSSEDEDIENPQFQKEFFKTLACLKKKDPCIYDEEVKFFNDTNKPEEVKNGEVKEKRKKVPKKKNLTLRDYERTVVIERDGRFSSSEDEDDARRKIKLPTYVEEQQELKDSFKRALKNEDEDDDIDFLKMKQKTEDEKHKEEESYKEWLKGQNTEINSQEQEEFKPLRDFWTDPNLDPNEKFLRDYILNNKYMDKESSDVDLDYEQIVHDSDENLSEDEKNIQKQEEFEHKYNFRFEEPDPEFIKRYPRTIENSMRKKDTRRAQKRAVVRQRKEEEKQQKKEELKQLKALKRKEIEEKIEKLKEITGNNDMCFDNVDFDADFDPNEHDRKMQELFNEDYYAGAKDDIKPEFPDIDEELGIEKTWDNYDPTVDEIDTKHMIYDKPHCEDPDFNMDADYDESRVLESELIENTKKRKRKRGSKFATLIAQKKPKYDPKLFPSYEEYFDQYYSLDYEDMIADLPCRFKYRKVVPNDYGLSVEEILTADDKELNKWCSLKRALQHKPELLEMKEVQSYKQKASNEPLKRKILKSLYTEAEEKEEKGADGSVISTEQVDTGNKKHRRKKNKKTNKPAIESTNPHMILKEKITDIAEGHSQNNSHDIENDKEQDMNAQEKIRSDQVVNQNEKRKRRKESKTNDTAASPKKSKIDDTRNDDDTYVTDNIDNTEKNNEDATFVETSADIQKKKNKKKEKKKKLQSNKMKNGKCKSNSESVHQLMSLDAERLRMYGINAKKFKNKLKYGNKKL